MERPKDLPEKFSDKFRDALKWGSVFGTITIFAAIAMMIVEGRNKVYSPLEAILTPICCALPIFYLR